MWGTRSRCKTSCCRVSTGCLSSMYSGVCWHLARQPHSSPATVVVGIGCNAYHASISLNSKLRNVYKIIFIVFFHSRILNNTVKVKMEVSYLQYFQSAAAAGCLKYCSRLYFKALQSVDTYCCAAESSKHGTGRIPTDAFLSLEWMYKCVGGHDVERHISVVTK